MAAVKERVNGPFLYYWRGPSGNSQSDKLNVSWLISIETSEIKLQIKGLFPMVLEQCPFRIGEGFIFSKITGKVKEDSLLNLYRYTAWDGGG